MRLKFSLFLMAVLLLASCSGGGSDDSGNNGGGSVPQTNACSVIGLSTRSASNSMLRIINGTACSTVNSPVVKIIIETTDPDSPFLCSGSLITPTSVLTAAHCFLGQTVLSTSVVANNNSIPGVPELHPQATLVGSGRAAFDVAIVHLARSLNVPTLPILVSVPIQEGDIMSIFGYGLDQNENYGVFRSGQTLVSNLDGQYIESDYAGVGSNSCFGDSGGPALISIPKAAPTQSGIVGLVTSGSLQSCGVGDVSVYTNVTIPILLNFIQSAAPGTNLL